MKNTRSKTIRANNCSVQQISVNSIIPNERQPRVEFDESSMIKLADSVQRYGVVQPLVVRKRGAENVYELVAGERRLRAAMLSKFEFVPCYVLNVGEQTAFEISLIENLLREDLNMFEEAMSFYRLNSEYGLSQSELARRLSLSQSTIANKIRLLDLSEEERELILESKLTERHARALLKLKSGTDRLAAINEINKRCLNVSESEEFIDGLLKPRSAVEDSQRRTVSDLIKSVKRKLLKYERAGNRATFDCRESENCFELRVTVYK